MNQEEQINIIVSENRISGNFNLPTNVPLARYLRWAGSQIAPSFNDKDYKVLKKSKGNEHPFLTVVTRTLGNRMKELEEVFLCLTGQCVTDFEIILVGHNIDSNTEDNLLDLVNSQPKWLKHKINLVSAHGGSRALPLNVAFSLAKGRYVSILDDDDVVFDNWVETFKNLSQSNDGAILHSYVFSQEWCTEMSLTGKKVLRAVSAPKPLFCDDFDAIEQLFTNHCPTMGLAFPTFLYQLLGFSFDDTLTTTEDWDFFMRSQFVCGVADCDVPTAIYRRWINAFSSNSLHSREEWDANRLKIQNKFYEIPILLPGGSSDALIKSKERRSVTKKYHIQAEEVKLFYRYKNEYSEARVIIPKKTDSEVDIFCFDFERETGLIESIRIDPRFHGFFTIKDTKIEIIEQNGSTYKYTTTDVKHNGFNIDEKTIVYIKEDPQIIIEFPNPKRISIVTIEVEAHDGVSGKNVEYILNTFYRQL